MYANTEPVMMRCDVIGDIFRNLTYAQKQLSLLHEITQKNINY